MRITMTPVIRLPVRKLISRGDTLEKSYDGATVLAATFTDSVATTMVNRAKATTIAPTRSSGRNSCLP